MQAMQRRALLHTSLLSAHKPLSVRELSKLLSCSVAEVENALDDLSLVLREQHLGLVLEEVGGGYRLIIQPTLYGDLAPLLSPPPLPPLSGAALETLALIAYKQPVTRGELEALRGTSCASTLETLQERELIKVTGRKEVLGRPLLYTTTARFLLEFGLRSLADLPPLSEQPTEFLRS